MKEKTGFLKNFMVKILNDSKNATALTKEGRQAGRNLREGHLGDLRHH